MILKGHNNIKGKPTEHYSVLIYALIFNSNDTFHMTKRDPYAGRLVKVLPITPQRHQTNTKCSFIVIKTISDVNFACIFILKVLQDMTYSERLSHKR